VNILSQNGDRSNLAPTPSEDELMANLEWDEEDLIKYPESEDDGITIVAVNALEMDLEAELGPAVFNMSEGPESMTSSRSFTASPNTERCVTDNLQLFIVCAGRTCIFNFQFSIHILKPIPLQLFLLLIMMKNDVSIITR
jgi:hypothetical protein